MSQSLKTIIPLFLGILVLLGYSYLGAQAPANPPSNNVAAPVNLSATAQTKAGAFGADTLTVFSTVPSLVLYDETPGQAPFRLRGESNFFQVLVDHNLDGNWFNNPGNHPFEILSSSTDPSRDYARVANDLLATRFCDRSRGNCFTASDIATLSTPLDTSSFLNTSATNQTKAGTLTAGNLFTAGQVRTANLCDAAGGNCTAPAAIIDNTSTAQTKAGNFGAPILTASTRLQSPNFCNTSGTNCTTPAEVRGAADATSLVNLIQRGSAPVPRPIGLASGVYTYNVTFPTAFAAVPIITITPRWTRYTGDESTSWWITNLSTTGFTINYQIPGSGTISGNDGVHWIAIQ